MNAPLAALTHGPTLAEIQRLQADMLASGDAIDLTDHTFHHFAEGVYGRELRIPAGIAVIGKMHRHSTLNVLAAGQLAVTTPDGPQILEAPAIFVSPPGCKKLGIALTDCVFLNVHASRETDLGKLEAELIVPETPAIEAEETPCLGSL
jgi:hypothetical protein